jgi:hypothetical protein
VRRSYQCPKCDGRELLYVPRLVDFQDSVIAAHVSSDDWASRGKMAVAGVVQAIICRGCGFMELYATDPEKIPVDQIPGARRLSPDDPYR